MANLSREQRFQRLDILHEALVWSSILAFEGAMAYCLVCGLIVNRSGLFLIYALATITIYIASDACIWRWFAIEYAIHRCLRYGETLQDNLPILHRMIYRYADYLAQKPSRRRFPGLSTGGFLCYGVLLLIGAFFSKTLITIIAHIAIVLAVILTIGMIVAILGFRILRRGRDYETITLRSFTNAPGAKNSLSDPGEITVAEVSKYYRSDF